MKKERTRKIKIKKCRKCNLYRIYYKIDSICQCDGVDAIYAIPVSVK